MPLKKSKNAVKNSLCARACVYVCVCVFVL